MEPFSDERTVLHAPSPAPLARHYPSISEEEDEWESTLRKDVLVGQRLGEYVVRRRIGSGGMGVVYEGEHPVIGRKVAIKIIRPDSSEGVRSRDLIDEARAASAIRHRGIIDIFGFGTLQGVGQYLVMEFLNGRPLDEVILDRAPMPPAEVIRLIIEVLGALSAAHAEGVIHRDLKPGNIFVVLESNGSEYVKVLDFGLAKRGAAPNSATPQTRASMIVGTPEYMAPEQACGQAVSPRTDLYAVGIIMFEMLTGRLPFRGESAMQTAIMQVQTPPPRPSKFVDGLPPELDDLILRLLAKEPEQRPVSADVVSRELKGIAKMLAVDMTQLSGFARAAPESATPAPRPPPRQEATGAAPQRTGARQAAPETLTAPGTRPVLAPPPANLAAARGGPAPRPAAPARPQAARPQAPRPQPQAPAPSSPPTTEVGMRNDVLRGSRSGMKLVVGVGLAAVLLGAGVGVVWLRSQDSGPTVPVTGQGGTPGTPVVGPVPRPKQEPQPVKDPPRAVEPQPEPKAQPQIAEPSKPETPPQDEPATPKKPGAETVAQEKDATSGAKPRSPIMTGNGTLRVVSACYTEVYVGNELKGGVPGPGALVSLPAGKYSVVLTSDLILNPRKTVTIRPGATFTYVADCDLSEN